MFAHQIRPNVLMQRIQKIARFEGNNANFKLIIFKDQKCKIEEIKLQSNKK